MIAALRRAHRPVWAPGVRILDRPPIIRRRSRTSSIVDRAPIAWVRWGGPTERRRSPHRSPGLRGVAGCPAPAARRKSAPPRRRRNRPPVLWAHSRAKAKAHASKRKRRVGFVRVIGTSRDELFESLQERLGAVIGGACLSLPRCTWGTARCPVSGRRGSASSGWGRRRGRHTSGCATAIWSGAPPARR